MTRDPLPDPGCDGEEPDGPGPLPGAGNGPDPAGYPEDDWDADAALDALVAAVDEGRYEPPADPSPSSDSTGGQGLFVCLPAERLDVAGFAQHGFSDAVPPGPLLAAVAGALAGEDGSGLDGLSDDQLMGVIGAAQRLESRAAWLQLAAVARFAARHPTGGGSRPGRAGASSPPTSWPPSCAWPGPRPGTGSITPPR
jgi:hypothetical protein